MNTWAEQVRECVKERSKDHVTSSFVVDLLPMAFSPNFTLYQVARLFHFVSSLDLREGQVTPLRGVTNSKPIQLGREALKPPLPTTSLSGSEAGVLLS